MRWTKVKVNATLTKLNVLGVKGLIYAQCRQRTSWTSSVKAQTAKTRVFEYKESDIVLHGLLDVWCVVCALHESS